MLAQQFILSRGVIECPPGFAHTGLGVWELLTGPDLPVAVARYEVEWLAVLGIAVDQDGKLVNQSRLDTLAAEKSADFAALARFLADSAGRFAIVLVTPEGGKVYSDAVGSLGVVYDPETGAVGSTLNVVLTREPEPRRDYPFAEAARPGQGRFAFGQTSDRAVRRLLPNHTLDLARFTIERFWPTDEDTALAEPTPEEELAVIRGMGTRLEQVIATLAKDVNGPTLMPLTGGVDSRLLLAFSKPVLEDISLFSHAEDILSRKDTRLAGFLGERVGKSVRVIDPLKGTCPLLEDPDVLTQKNLSYKIATGLEDTPTPVRHTVFQEHPAGGIVLRGNTAEFLKAVLWGRGVHENNNKAHNIPTGVKKMMLGEDANLHPQIQAEYSEWYAGLPHLAALRPFDLMFAEHFLPRRLGNLFYGFTRNLYICPSNDRRFIAAATSLPPNKRQSMYYHEVLLNWRAPELADIRHTRPRQNQLFDTLRNSDTVIPDLS